MTGPGFPPGPVAVCDPETAPLATTGPDPIPTSAPAPAPAPRGAALLARLEAGAREELAAAAAGRARRAAPDPVLACLDWDLGVAGAAGGSQR